MLKAILFFCFVILGVIPNYASADENFILHSNICRAAFSKYENASPCDIRVIGVENGFVSMESVKAERKTEGAVCAVMKGAAYTLTRISGDIVSNRHRIDFSGSAIIITDGNSIPMGPLEDRQTGYDLNEDFSCPVFWEKDFRSFD